MAYRDSYITVKKVSEALGTSKQNTFRFLDAGGLKAKKRDSGKLSPYLITVSDFEQFIRNRAVALRQKAESLENIIRKDGRY